MLAAGLALSRGFWRLHLHHGAAHAARQQQRHAAGGGVAVAAAAAVRRQHAMATADGGEAGPPPGQLDAAKRRVREEVKGALRALGAAQMAEESECPPAGEDGERVGESRCCRGLVSLHTCRMDR